MSGVIEDQVLRFQDSNPPFLVNPVRRSEKNRVELFELGNLTVAHSQPALESGLRRFQPTLLEYRIFANQIPLLLVTKGRTVEEVKKRSDIAKCIERGRLMLLSNRTWHQLPCHEIEVMGNRQLTV